MEGKILELAKQAVDGAIENGHYEIAKGVYLSTGDNLSDSGNFKKLDLKVSELWITSDHGLRCKPIDDEYELAEECWIEFNAEAEAEKLRNTDPADLQKTIASILDNAATRAETVGANPASSKQCWYLAKLIVDAGGDGSEYLQSSEVMTKRKASGLIDFYLKEQN